MDLVLPSSQPWLPERPARCHRVGTSGVDRNAHSGVHLTGKTAQKRVVTSYEPPADKPPSHELLWD